VDEVVVTVIADVPVPPELTVMFTGLKEIDGPGLEIEAAKPTAPAKPLRLLRDIVELTEAPTMTERKTGLAVMAKAGSGGELTITVILTEWTSELPVPVTVRV
jgi:hypothetical protein